MRTLVVVVVVARVWVTHLAGVRCNFVMIVPLLPFHCSFSFVLEWRVSFLVGSGISPCLMAVQQLIVILVLWQEMSARSFAPVLSQSLKTSIICKYPFLIMLSNFLPSSIERSKVKKDSPVAQTVENLPACRRPGF